MLISRLLHENIKYFSFFKLPLFKLQYFFVLSKTELNGRNHKTKYE